MIEDIRVVAFTTEAPEYIVPGTIYSVNSKYTDTFSWAYEGRLLVSKNTALPLFAIVSEYL